MENPEVNIARECADAPSHNNLSAVEGISPDLLENTTSNIAISEDVIDQSKSRQKYLACTKSPSDGEEVRWYFSKLPLAEKELAASLPRAPIIGKDDYFRFSMRDSLTLESYFLQREEEFLAHWWKEYAECSEGPNQPCKTNFVTSIHNLNEHIGDEERVGVPVKGGLYEVDLTKRHCFPVYWSSENRRVLRGFWFACNDGLNWLPLREDIAEQLEFAYRCQVWRRRKFQPSGKFAARVDLQGTKEGLHAIFTGDDDAWEAWLVIESSGFPINIGGGNEVKLRRGYSPSGSPNLSQDELRQQREEEIDDYCAQVPVGHLVLMVHGIGQTLQYANLINDVADFRHITESLASRHLTPYQRNTQRVLFVPCQWRRGLELSGESTIKKITLDGVRGLRATLNATVHDVLYYMSPIYCQDIIDSVSNQLNKQYSKFLKRNRGYNGKVSIFAHSLGSVLCYDMLCHQESPVRVHCKDNLCIPKQESMADVAHQSFEYSGRMTFDHEDTKDNIALEPAANVSVELSSISESYSKDSIVYGHKPQEIPCIEGHAFTKAQQESSLVNCGIQRSDDSTQLAGQESVLNLGQVGMSKNVLSEPCCAEDRSASADRDIRSDSQGDKVGDVEHPPEDVIDKDKLISLLQEEVKSLKAEVAYLRKDDQSTSNFHNSDDNRDDVDPGKRQMIISSTKLSSRSFSSAQDYHRQRYTPYINYTRLDFKVDTFFAAGSPLGVFLALRNVRIGAGRGQSYWGDEKISEEMPSCRQMFNIFHPYDPVAYRVEPLVCKEYISMSPALIPYHKGGKKLRAGIQGLTEDVAARSQAIMTQLNSFKVKMTSKLKLKRKNDTEETVKEETKQRSYGSLMLERLTGFEGGRIDYALQEETFQHPYLSAIASHTSYWRDNDTALFVLNHLYHDIPEEPTTKFQDVVLLAKERHAKLESNNRDVMD